MRLVGMTDCHCGHQCKGSLQGLSVVVSITLTQLKGCLNSLAEHLLGASEAQLLNGGAG